jgi:hypothetical protein
LSLTWYCSFKGGPNITSLRHALGMCDGNTLGAGALSGHDAKTWLCRA